MDAKNPTFTSTSSNMPRDATPWLDLSRRKEEPRKCVGRQLRFELGLGLNIGSGYYDANDSHYYLRCALKRVTLMVCVAWLIPTLAVAGPFNLSGLSRANCSGFNESVTWMGGSLIAADKLSMETESVQWFDTIAPSRIFVDTWKKTWRSYAGCQFCGSSGWVVDGEHYVTSGYGPGHELYDYVHEVCDGSYVDIGENRFIPCFVTHAVDCNLSEW